MIIYVILIGGLLAISTGYAAGMRERKAGVLKLLFSRPISKEDFLLGKLLGDILSPGGGDTPCRSDKCDIFGFSGKP